MSKVLVIGLDGGTYEILRPLKEKGLIPTIGRMMDEGFSAVLRSTVPPVTAPAWTSFITGVNPGEHGIFQFYDLRPGRIEGREVFPGVFAFVNARSIRLKTLWQMLSEAGKRLIVINVPMTYPPTPINGLMIACMLTPPGARDFTYPPELVDSIEDYIIDLNFDEKELSSPKDKLIERLREILERRARVSLRLMREHEWDLFMIVFKGTDHLQHRFWHSLDPQSPWYCHPQAERYRPAVEEYYRRLDEIIAQFRREAQGAFTLLISDHGFGPLGERVVYVDQLMKELLKGAEGPKATSESAVLRLRGFTKRVGLDWRTRRRLLRRFLPDKAVIRLERAARSRLWAASKAYFVSLHEFIGGIWINTKGPDGRGLVEPGAEYEALRDNLVERLKEIQDRSTGTRLVEKVYRREELYHGRLMEGVPDLIFFVKPGYVFSREMGRADTLVAARPDPLNQPLQGTHREEGILILQGKGARKGKCRSSYDIQDVTATILHLLGLPIPRYLDGQVIQQALAKTFLQEHPVDFSEGEASLKDAAKSIWGSEEDQKKIEERLRGIGYI